MTGLRKGGAVAAFEEPTGRFTGVMSFGSLKIDGLEFLPGPAGGGISHFFVPSSPSP